MDFRHKVGFGLSIAVLCLIASILLVEPAGLRQEELEVWVPNGHPVAFVHDGPPSLEAYPWATLVSEFNRDFPKVKLRFKILERADFLRVLHSAEMKPHPPDIVFADNSSEEDPLISSGAVVRKGGSRFEFHGLWLLLPHSKNVRTGHAFMLWLSQSPHWKPWTLGTATMSQDDKAAVQAVSGDVVKAVALADYHSLSANMDPEACYPALWSDPTNKVVSINSLITFGNSRLAFVLMSWVGQGERLQTFGIGKAAVFERTFGMEHSALVLRKVGDRWKVFLFLRGQLPFLEEYILKPFDRMELENGQPEAIAQVSLVSPVDHARITRFPDIGVLVWKPLNPLPAAYVVEHQFGAWGADSWSSSGIDVISPGRAWVRNRNRSTAPKARWWLDEPLIRMGIPFGTGAQPHRWRVWAISGTGVVSTSDWRTVDFTN